MLIQGDGRYLISNCKDQSIKLWDVRKFSSQSALEVCTIYFCKYYVCENAPPLRVPLPEIFTIVHHMHFYQLRYPYRKCSFNILFEKK